MKKLVNFVLVLIKATVTMFASTVVLYTAFMAAIAFVDKISEWAKTRAKKKGGESEKVVEE